MGQGAARDLGALARGRRGRGDRPRPHDRGRRRARRCRRPLVGPRSVSWHHRRRDPDRRPPRPRRRVTRSRRADAPVRSLREAGRSRGSACASDCNPLGLRDAASAPGPWHRCSSRSRSAIVLLAVAARLSVAGIGPFPATVDGVAPAGDGLTVTLTVTNEGDSAGQTTCRHQQGRATGARAAAAFVSARGIEPDETRTFSTVVTELGTAARRSPDRVPHTVSGASVAPTTWRSRSRSRPAPARS